MSGSESRVSSDEVWRAIAKRSFAVLSWATPSGEPRASGVVYKATERRLYIAAAPTSWKTKHIAATKQAAVTVPVRRGGVLSLFIAIPAATISFPAHAVVHQPNSAEADALLDKLGSMLPPERRVHVAVIELAPTGAFVTYGVGVSLLQMRHPAAASGRVPVT